MPAPAPDDPLTAGDRRIEYVRVDDLPAAERNPKGHDLAGIKQSIVRFGFTGPGLLDERTGRLVAGHGRRDAVAELAAEGAARPPDGVRVDDDGTWMIPITRGWASKDDAHAEAVIVADNRLTEAGGWDNRMLAELLEDIADYSPDLLVATGFDQDELDALIHTHATDRSLEDLADEYGDPEERATWPRVLIVMPPDTMARYQKVRDTRPGEEHEQFDALVRAAAAHLDVQLDDAGAALADSFAGELAP